MCQAKFISTALLTVEARISPIFRSAESKWKSCLQVEYEDLYSLPRAQGESIVLVVPVLGEE